MNSVAQGLPWGCTRITPRNEVLLEKLIVGHVFKKFPALWKANVHYHVHKAPPLVLILSQINLAHIFTPIYLRSILILSSHLRQNLTSGLFLHAFQPICCTHFSSILMRATCPALLILLDLILIIFSEDYTFLSYSLCNFLHPPATSSLLGPNILLSTLFSNILKLCSPLDYETPSCTPVQGNK
jgi:hypothetical protein